MDYHLLLILFGVALSAGIIDSIAGGGGLLALPAILMAGVDPVSALATNKLQGSFGTGSAVWAFGSKGLIDFKASRWMVITVFMAAVLGVMAVAIVPNQWLLVAMPVALILIAVYFALSSHLASHDGKPRISGGSFALTAAPSIGFYDGLFGPGAGSFYLLSFVMLRGLGVLKATAHTKLLNFTSNIAALLVFAWGGHVMWGLGIVMGLGQFFGAQIGSRLAIRKGAQIIRPLLVTVSVAMAIKLLLNPANPLRLLLGV